MNEIQIATTPVVFIKAPLLMIMLMMQRADCQPRPELALCHPKTCPEQTVSSCAVGFTVLTTQFTYAANTS